MTVAELLALIGRSAAPLLLWPGGLALLMLLVEHRSGPLTGPWHALALPWVALAFVPLPGALRLERGADLLVLLALAEWPRLVAITHDTAHPGDRARGVARAAALLSGWIVLAAVLPLIASGTGALTVEAIARSPAATAPATDRAGFVLAAIALLLVLPVLLELGPWRVAAASPGVQRAGLRTRALLLCALVALPLVAPLRDAPAPFTYMLPLPPLLLAFGLWGIARATRTSDARRWSWLTPGLAILILVMMVSQVWMSNA